MRTTDSTSGTTGKARRAATTLAALCLALPMSGLLGGTAYATNDKSADHGSSAAKGQDKKAEPTPQAAPAPAPETASSTDAKPGKSDHSQGNASTTGSYNQPQPYSNADQNNHGANDTSSTNQYKSTRDGSPSMNGNGGGNAHGKPCAGCVGKADNKNPKGQYPNGSDHNNGYECDGNHGIGRGNPAHTGCTAGTPSPNPSPTTQPCPSGTHMEHGKCKPNGSPSPNPSPTTQPCPSGTHMGHGKCKPDSTPSPNPSPSTQPCPSGTHMEHGTCKPDSSPSPNPSPTACPAGTHMEHGTCKTDHGGNKNDKITICHATGSAKNPFVVITPNKNGVVHGHAKHGDDIIPPFDYNDHGVTKHFPGQNWTAANQVLFHNGCTAPPAPPTCPNGQPMPASGVCGGGGGGGVTCPNGAPMPASGNLADCNPPVVCPAGTTMVNGTCTPPVTCPAGTTMAANSTCSPPVVCPEGSAMVGPIVPGTTRPGCVVSGDNGGPAVVPPTTPTTGVIGTGGTPQPALGGTPAPTVVTARPTALPFTGVNAGLLAEGAALMLLIGGGLVLATRRKAVVAG